jgi:hypothetical protein
MKNQGSFPNNVFKRTLLRPLSSRPEHIGVPAQLPPSTRPPLTALGVHPRGIALPWHNSSVEKATSLLYSKIVTSREFKRWLEQQGCSFSPAKGSHLKVRLGRRSTIKRDLGLK